MSILCGIISRNTSVLSAIEMLHDIALYEFNIHIHIYWRSWEESTEQYFTISLSRRINRL